MVTTKLKVVKVPQVPRLSPVSLPVLWQWDGLGKVGGRGGVCLNGAYARADGA